MKKVLFSMLFAASAAMGLSSCMNGDYDANPNGVNSGTNPLSQNNGGSGGGGGGGGTSGVAAKGEIRCSVDGNAIVIKNAVWSSIVGRTVGGNVQTGTIDKAISFIITSTYNGAGTYPVDEPSGNNATYKYTDFATGPTVKTFRSAEIGAGGTGQVIVTDDSNNEMKGTFSFTAFFNGEKVTVTNGSFWATK